MQQKRDTLPSFGKPHDAKDAKDAKGAHDAGSAPNVPIPQNKIPREARLTSSKPDAEMLLATLAEQMRVPLTGVQLQLQLLTRSLTRSPNLPASQLSPRVQTLQLQARRLADMIDAAEDFSRVLGGGLQSVMVFMAFDLDILIRSIAKELAERAHEQGCEIRISSTQPLWGEWDQPRLRRVIMSLVQNALQFAPRHPVVISARTADHCGYVEVTDQGPGIQDADLERLHHATPLPVRTQSGAGMGLWLSAAVARAMGGRLEGRRLKAGGSSFTLELPLSPLEAPREGGS